MRLDPTAEPYLLLYGCNRQRLDDIDGREPTDLLQPLGNLGPNSRVADRIEELVTIPRQAVHQRGGSTRKAGLYKAGLLKKVDVPDNPLGGPYPRTVWVPSSRLAGGSHG